MEKKVSFVKNCIKGVLLIGMSVQIVLGIIWMGANLFSVQDFEETAEYVEMSCTFLLDEYVGVLYPLLLRICPVCTLVYILQLCAAFLSGCLFCCFSGLGEEKLFAGKNIFSSLYLLTIPFTMQLHMAILPQSFTLSLFLLQLGLCMRVIRRKTEKYISTFVCCCVLWTGMALLLPDYLWLGGVTVVWLLAVCIKRKCGKRQAAILFACMAGAICLTIGINAVTQTPGSRGRIQRTLGAAVVSRLAWPALETNYFFWPEEVKKVMSPMQGREISKYADNVKTVLGPLLEDAFGKKQANAYYWEMGLRCLSDRTKEVVSRIVADFIAYLFPPASVGWQLSGGGVSYSGWNFDRMWEQAKPLTGFYVEYSVGSHIVGMLFAMLTFLVKKTKYSKTVGYPKTAICKGSIWLVGICMLMQAVWYTMSGTYMMDYKNVPIIIILWYACILWVWKQYDMSKK